MEQPRYMTEAALKWWRWSAHCLWWVFKSVPVYQVEWLCQQTPCSRFDRVYASQTNWKRRQVLPTSSETLHSQQTTVQWSV